MKCPSCKYEQRTVSQFTDHVVRYKSGKRKGEIKDVESKLLVFYNNDPSFIELEFEKDVDRIVERDSGDWLDPKKECGLYACPKCGTMIVKHINEAREF